MIQEYPKALYLSGEVRIVDDLEQEDAAREEGYLDWRDDHVRLNEPTDPLDREALKARAAELGVEFPRNITTEKLAELVAEAERDPE